jgi:hypothetical protein
MRLYQQPRNFLPHFLYTLTFSGGILGICMKEDEGQSGDVQAASPNHTLQNKNLLALCGQRMSEPNED